MKFLLIIILITFTSALPDTLTWSVLPNTLVACRYTAGAYFSGKFYQICGMDLNYQDYKYIQIYDGSGWSQSISSHPMGICTHSAAVWNGKIVISGGSSQATPGGYYDYTTMYDPIDTSWIVSTPMPQDGMCFTGMATVNGKCYLFGSEGPGSTLDTTYEWVPGAPNMTSKASMPAPRCDMAVAECNGKMYLFGGRQEPNLFFNSIWEYNPVSNSWIIKNATLSTNRIGAGAVTIGTKIYVIAGRSNWNAYLNSVDIYDIISDTISTGTSLLNPISSFATAGYFIQDSNTTYTGHIYVSGGSNGSTTYNTAYLGTVSGVYCNKVQPTSLGNLKALYH